MTSAGRRRCADDNGAAAVEMPLAVGLLLLPIAMLVMLVPQWPERQTVARAAAKEAASLYANAPNAASGAAQAHAAVARASANYGLPSGAMSVTLEGEWCRGCTVTASVTIDIPAFAVPLVGTVGGFSWSTSSSARIDDYASLASAGEGP
jgi:hypothetical protein